MKIDDRAKKLRIAFVLDRYNPRGRGEGYFSWLIEALSKRGHDVHVFAGMSDETATARYHLHKVRTLRFPRSLMMASFLINSNRAIRQERFDVVHGVGRCLCMSVFNPHGGVEKAYLKQEFSSMEGCLYTIYNRLKRHLSLQHYLKLWVQKNQYASPDVKKIIAISEMVKRDIMRYHRVPEGKITVLSNCVDLERFHPKNRTLYRESRRRALGIDAKTLILLFAGNNFRLKGLVPLLRAVAQLRRRYPDQDICLWVAGRGQTARFSRIARRLGISRYVTFLGSVQGMEEYYAASDIYVHPTFYDPCSLTVLEALASGLPVVTTRFNGAADVMTSNEAGKVIEDPGDIEILAEAIAWFFDEGRRDEARVVARQWMENHPPARHVEEMLNIYYEAAGQAGV